MQTKLRRSNRQDIPAIAGIYIQEFSKPPYNEPWTLEKALSKMRFFDQNYDLYTIQFGENIAGFVVVNPNFMCPGEVAFGEEFAISQEYQGRNIGTIVLKELFEIYKERGYKRFLGIAARNSRALRLYEHLGFLPCEIDLLIEKKLD